MDNAEENLKSYLSDNLHLEDLTETAARLGYDCWLVGGALRDVLLGRPVADVDLVTTADPTPLAKSWAKQQNAHWFWLDKERCQSRVLLRYGKLEFYFDFAPLRAETLVQDLSLRDFTINALALPLISPLTTQNLYDPLDGQRDLESALIRSCSEQSLADDPLRILKGIRHCVTLGFQLAQETEVQMRETSERLATTAGERKRNELGRILSSGNLAQGLELLDRCQLMHELFGPSVVPLSRDALATNLVRLEKILSQWMERDTLSVILSEAVDEFIDRRALYLLAFLFRNRSTQNLTVLLREKLRLSCRAVTIVETLVSFDFRKFKELDTLPDRPRVKCLWLENLGPAAVDQLLFCAAVIQSDRLNISIVQQLLEDFTRTLTHDRVPDLLSGREIMKLFPEISGRQIGQYQKQIKEAEITGEIINQKDARKLLSAEFSFDKN